MRRIIAVVAIALLAVGVYAGRASSSAPRLRWYAPGHLDVSNGGGIYINVHNPTSRTMHVLGHLDQPNNWTLSPDEPVDVPPHGTSVVLWLCTNGGGCNGAPLVKAPTKAIIDMTYNETTPPSYVHIRPGELTSFPA